MRENNLESLNIFVIVLTCNNEKLIFSCLSQLTRLKKGNFKISIIVVDNGSKDRTIQLVKNKFPKVILITNQVNYGFAKGINYGLKLAYQQSADYLLLLNDDVIVSDDFVFQLVSHAEKKSYFICGPKIKTVDNKIWSLGGLIDKLHFSGSLIGLGEDDRRKNKDVSVDFISGTAMLVNRAVFQKIGFLDEDYFLYYDDVDFCFRAKKQGFQSILVPSVEIVHLETATIKKNSPSHFYHAAKSHLIFVLKRAPFRIKLREFLRIFKDVFGLIFEENEVKQKYELLAIRDFFLGRFGQRTSIKPF